MVRHKSADAKSVKKKHNRYQQLREVIIQNAVDIKGG